MLGFMKRMRWRSDDGSSDTAIAITITAAILGLLVLVGVSGAAQTSRQAAASKVEAKQQEDALSKDMASFVGTGESDVIKAWGPPQDTQTLANGSKLFIYKTKPGKTCTYWVDPAGKIYDWKWQ